MDPKNLNLLDRKSGLLPKGVAEVGLEDDGLTAWCVFRDREDPLALIDVDAGDAESSLARHLIFEHSFPALFAIATARQLYAEHRRRNARH